MLTIKSQHVVLFAIAMLCVGSCFSMHFPAFGEDTDSTPSKLTSLLQERRDVLKTRVEMVEHLTKIAVSAPEALVAARHDLLDAEYELATSSQQRIGVLQQKLENAKQFEAIMQQRKLAAKGTEADVLLAKARRLGVEINLLKEQETQGKSQ